MTNQQIIKNYINNKTQLNNIIYKNKTNLLSKL